MIRGNDPGAPTSLDHNTVSQTLGLYDIASEQLSVDQLRQGDDNLNILVSVRDARYVLRLYRITPRTEVMFELALVDFLASRHFPTPRVHRSATGEFLVDVNGAPAALFDFVPGQPIATTDPGDGMIGCHDRWNDDAVEVAPDWSGPAYGEVDRTTEEAIRLGARLEGLATDPVYSGKGLAGLIGLARRGRFRDGGPVVWIHTGGIPGIFAYPITMARLASRAASSESEAHAES